MDELAAGDEAATDAGRPIVDEGLDTIAEDEVVDYITRKPVKETAKEKVRLKDLMGHESMPQVNYGLWTNGLDLFFLHKEINRWGPVYEPCVDWPQADETLAAAVSPPTPGCGAAKRACSRPRFVAVTTTSTATRVYPRMRRSGSSCTCCSRRFTTSRSTAA